MSAPSIAAAPKVRLLAVIAAVVLAADIVTKVLAVAQLEGQEPVELLGGLVYLHAGAQPGSGVLAGHRLHVGAHPGRDRGGRGDHRVARRLRSTGWAVALGLVLGGALGNLTDRSSARPARCRGTWSTPCRCSPRTAACSPVFNLADSAIVTGGVLLVLLALLGRELDGTRASDREQDPAGG